MGLIDGPAARGPVTWVLDVTLRGSVRGSPVVLYIPKRVAAWFKRWEQFNKFFNHCKLLLNFLTYNPNCIYL